MTHSFTPHAIAPEYCATCAVHRSQHPQLSAAVPTKAANSELSAAIANIRHGQENASRIDYAQRIATNGIPSEPRAKFLMLMRDQTGTVTFGQIYDAANEVIAEHEAGRAKPDAGQLRHDAGDDKRDTADSLTEERLRDLLRRAESFISGFEDDEAQEGIPELLAAIRAEIEPARDGVPELLADLNALHPMDHN